MDCVCSALIERKIHKKKQEKWQTVFQIETADRKVYKCVFLSKLLLCVMPTPSQPVNSTRKSRQSVIFSGKPPTTSTPLEECMHWEGRHSWHWLISCVQRGWESVVGVGLWLVGHISWRSHPELTDWERQSNTRHDEWRPGWFHALWKSPLEQKKKITFQSNSLHLL